MNVRWKPHSRPGTRLISTSFFTESESTHASESFFIVSRTFNALSLTLLCLGFPADISIVRSKLQRVCRSAGHLALGLPIARTLPSLEVVSPFAGHQFRKT